MKKLTLFLILFVLLLLGGCKESIKEVRLIENIKDVQSIENIENVDILAAYGQYFCYFADSTEMAAFTPTLYDCKFTVLRSDSSVWYWNLDSVAWKRFPPVNIADATLYNSDGTINAGANLNRDVYLDSARLIFRTDQAQGVVFQTTDGGTNGVSEVKFALTDPSGAHRADIVFTNSLTASGSTAAYSRITSLVAGTSPVRGEMRFYVNSGDDLYEILRLDDNGEVKLGDYIANDSRGEKLQVTDGFVTDNIFVDSVTTFIPRDTFDITAGGGVNGLEGTIIRIQGSGGAINITADPQVSDGKDGQIIYMTRS